jgi:DNA-binding NarL/FixJ family response regulator
LVEAIHSVYKGETFIASDIKDRYFTSLLNVDSEAKKELTMKEIEIVKHIAKGLLLKKLPKSFSSLIEQLKHIDTIS